MPARGRTCPARKAGLGHKPGPSVRSWAGRLMATRHAATLTANARGRTDPRSAALSHHHKFRLHRLLHVRPGDIHGSLVLDLAVRGEPLLAAREEIVEGVRRHLAGEVGVTADGDQPAQRLALLDR